MFSIKANDLNFGKLYCHLLERVLKISPYYQQNIKNIQGMISDYWEEQPSNKFTHVNINSIFDCPKKT